MEKGRNKKIVILSVLVVIMLLLTIAFSTMNVVLNIDGNASFNPSEWNIYFDNLSISNVTGSAEEISKPKIINKTTIDNIDIFLNNPKDMISYYVELINEGDIDAEIDDVMLPNLSDDQKKYINIELLYEDGNIVKKGDVLQRMTLKKMILKIKFNEDISKEDLPKEKDNIDFSCKLTFVQADNTEIGPNVTTIKSESHASDSNPGDITNAGLYDGSVNNPYMIESVEDLVQFSNDVNNGTTYSNKYIILSQDIDFNESGSYVDSKTILYGDINGDGIISGLKEELTTNLGFNPIGNNSNQFKGTFDGKNHIINNLNIERENTDYVGLFGYASGTIKNLKIENFKIKGNNNVGALVGYYSGTATNIEAESNVEGNNYVGGVIGQKGTINASKVKSIVKGNEYVGGVIGGNYGAEGKVNNNETTSTVTGNTYVGGIVGYGNVTSGIMKGDVTGDNYVGGIVGSSRHSSNGGIVKAVYASGNVEGNQNTNLLLSYTGTTLSGYVVKGVTLNGKEVTSDNINGVNGLEVERLTQDMYKGIGFNFDSSVIPYWIYNDGSVLLKFN